MASPIGYLIHHDPPPAPNTATPLHSAAGSRTPFSVAPSHGPVSASPPLVRPGPDHPAASTPPTSHTKSQSLYQCADCLRRYSRPEHLQRHIAAHTLGKRFTCDICSKGFARADLLKRHRANHQDENSNKRRRFNTVPSASRVGQACIGCSKARVKCEETKPCTRCKNRGLACEIASSEDAAMYLVHLSGNRAEHQESTPESCYSQSSGAGPPQHQLTAHLTSSSVMQSASPEESKEGITTPTYPSYPEEDQLPTPGTSSASVDQNSLDNPRSYPRDDVDYTYQASERPNFPEFLRDVLYDQPMGGPARAPEAQGPAMLDFYDDANLDFKEFDFGLLDHWNFEPPRNVPDQTISSEDPGAMTAMRSALVKMWTESPWRWTPGKTDNCYTEQSNLPLPSPHAHGPPAQDSQTARDRAVQNTLHPACRDKILAIVLSTCREPRMASKVASSFPSANTMDSWINIFLAAHMCQVSSWIHYGSLSINNQWPEWLAIASAAGAVLTPVPAFRSFGLALQEAIRIAIPERFEENNRTIAEISKVQALVLVQDVGLWSGNRRKMEIAECHLSIPIAMMRYRSKFSRSAYPDIVIYSSDEGKVLEEKWKKWYQFESWKRLVFHAYLRDTQVSMTQLNNPSMSYAELTLPLPCSKELWFARTADEFKIRYLESVTPGNNKPLPSLDDLFRDINTLSAHHHRLDVQFAISIYLHGFWSLIWELRQLSSIHPLTSTSSNNNTHLLLASRHADLVSSLKSFQSLTRDWHEMLLSAQESLLLHLLLLNLHVSLPDLQLFSGKEGEEQARRAYPALKRWGQGADARVALWHAAQILRMGSGFPRGHLKDFWSVAVCHAGLAIWAWGVVTGAGVRQQQGQERQRADRRGAGVVYLDGEETADVQTWVSYGQGRPAIQGLDAAGGGEGQGGGSAAECLLEDPRACMEVAQEILRANFVGVWETLPPLSENIIAVLKQLEKAAWAVGMG